MSESLGGREESCRSEGPVGVHAWSSSSLEGGGGGDEEEEGREVEKSTQSMETGPNRAPPSSFEDEEEGFSRGSLSGCSWSRSERGAGGAGGGGFEEAEVEGGGARVKAME